MRLVFAAFIGDDILLLGDGFPQFDDLLGTSRGHDVVVAVVADGVD